MIEIVNGNVLIDGVIITNPELIGLAMLDLAEQKLINKGFVKQKYFEYITLNKIYRTPERESLIDLMIDKNITDILILTFEAKKIHITKASAYSTIKLLVEAKILICHQKKYTFN